MRVDDGIRIRHMVDAAEAALGFVQGRARPELDTNAMLRYALVRAVEVVGEAAGKVSPEGRAELPQVPWAIGGCGEPAQACAIGWFMRISTSIWTSCGSPYSRRCPTCWPN